MSRWIVRLRCWLGWHGTRLYPANHNLACDECACRVLYFDRLGEWQGPSRLQPCGHRSDYHDTTILPGGPAEEKTP
jgi:hypothetical protein